MLFSTHIGGQRRSWCQLCRCRFLWISEEWLWPKPAVLSLWSHLPLPQTCQVCSSQSCKTEKYRIYSNNLSHAMPKVSLSHILSLDHSPVRKTVFLPLISKGGETSRVHIRNATAGLLHHRHGVSIQRPGDLETKESLHLSQLLDRWADPPSDSWTALLS